MCTIMMKFRIAVKSQNFSEQDKNQSKSSLTTTLRNIFQHLTFKNLKLLDYYNGIQMESLAERDKNSFQNSKKILITKNLIDQFRLKLELSQWLSSMVRSKIKLKYFLTPCQVKRGQGKVIVKKVELDKSIQIFCLWSLYLATIQMNDTNLKNWQLRRGFELMT